MTKREAIERIALVKLVGKALQEEPDTFYFSILPYLTEQVLGEMREREYAIELLDTINKSDGTKLFKNLSDARTVRDIF